MMRVTSLPGRYVPRGALKKTSRVARFDNRELFHGFSEEQSSHILSLGRPRVVDPARFFFRQGEPSRHLYFLDSGRTKIYQVTGSGRQALMRFVLPGEVFGYDGLLPSESYATSAEAVEPSRAVAWKREVLMRLVHSNPRLATNLLMMTAQALDELREQYIYHTTQTVESRIAWALIKLGQQIGRKTSDPMVIPEESIQKDVADLAGTTIYTVSRVLSIWEREGTITKSRGRIVVYHPSKITELAQTLA
jgi:CRP/FNR family transcriptional regulator, nitrogen oxide reductase regulator